MRGQPCRPPCLSRTRREGHDGEWHKPQGQEVAFRIEVERDAYRGCLGRRPPPVEHPEALVKGKMHQACLWMHKMRMTWHGRRTLGLRWRALVPAVAHILRVRRPLR